jgi:hypothetical protein
MKSLLLLITILSITSLVWAEQAPSGDIVSATSTSGTSGSYGYIIPQVSKEDIRRARFERRATRRKIRKNCRKSQGKGLKGLWKKVTKCTFAKTAAKKGYDPNGELAYRKNTIKNLRNTRKIQRSANRHNYFTNCKSQGKKFCGIKKLFKSNYQPVYHPILPNKVKKGLPFVVKNKKMAPQGYSNQGTSNSNTGFIHGNYYHNWKNQQNQQMNAK